MKRLANPDNNIPPLFLGTLLFIFGFWDVYITSIGLRPLDIIGLILILFYVLLMWHKTLITLKLRDMFVLSIIGFILLLYLALGLHSNPLDFKLSIGLLLGFFVFWFTYSISFEPVYIYRYVSIFCLINVLFFFLQYTTYNLFEILLTPYSFIGLEPRAFSSIFRPTGLYLEPASYCHTIFMLILIRYFYRQQHDLLAIMSLLSMLLSLSLWGIITSIIFVLLTIVNSNFTIKKLIFIFGALLTFFIYFYPAYTLSDNYADFFQNRMDNLSSDASFLSRFGNVQTALIDTSYLEIIFGRGFTNENVIYGSNGFLFIEIAFGIFGTILISLFFALLSKFKFTFLKVIMFFIALTAAPMWNTFFWWFWLALFFRSIGLGNISRASKA